MAEARGFAEAHKQLRSVAYGGGRDVSPDDSVIFSVESNFSLFSSTSASVERCSSASDNLHDHDSLVSEINLHLSGRGFRETSGGPDPDPNKSKKVEAAKVVKEYEEVDTEVALDSARSSFSQALRECQNRRSRSEAGVKISDRRRPASLDLNNQVINATSSSPRLGVTMKASVSTRRTGAFPSPGTPNYRPTSIGVHKGWSSERVPLQTNASRRNVSSALLPYNSGKTLPSKWEDAERWIFSPVSGDSAIRSFQQPQRRPKSKSGPLGPPGAAYYSMYSPALPTFDGGNLGNLITGSPFSAGVMGADGLSVRYSDGHDAGGYFPLFTEPCMARSVSVHGCSELLSQSLLRTSQDDKLDCVMDSATNISRDVSRRDMATQMSPEGSQCSSPRRRTSSSLSTSIVPIVELQNVRLSKADVRDVQVDDQVTVTRWSKKNRVRIPGRSSEIVDDWKRKAMEVRSADWEVSETTKNLSKIKREEAKITAWENLQKAKAEASIRKLEMKLEKKRSSSMDKIMNKLRSAQKKAQEMRGSILATQTHQVARTSHRAISLRRARQIGSLSGCFACHAF